MNRYYFVLLILCVVALAFAQNATVADIKWANQRANRIMFDKKDSALLYANRALQLATQIDSPKLMYDVERTIGSIYEEYKDFPNAKIHYKNAIDIAHARLPKRQQFIVYTDWAIVHKKLGQYDTAREYHQKTVDEAEKIGDWEMAEEGYHGLGTMHSMMSDFNKSIEVYYKSIEAAEKWGNTEGVVLTEQNISNIYMKAKNYDMALKNIEKTYRMALKLGDSMRIAAVLKIYGNINLAMGDFTGALDHHSKAKSIIEKQSNKTKLAESYLALGEIQLNLKNYPEAQAYFDTCKTFTTFLHNYAHADLYQKQGKLYQVQNLPNLAITAYLQSLKLTDSFGFKEIARDNHLTLTTLFTLKKDFSAAIQHATTANQLSAELFEEKNQKNMTEAQFKFNTEKRDLQIEAQKKELRQATLFRWALLGGLAILLGLLVFTWRQMKEKQKAKERTEFIIRELHHRVKNNMQTVASMMRLQAQETTDPSVAAILLENKTRLETFSMLHHQLYLKDRVETLDLQPFVESMLSKLRFLYNLQSEENFKISLVFKTHELGTDTALSVGLILNELLTNSFKYAAPSVSPLEVYIQICADHFVYTDNGQVLTPDFDFQKSEGFGVQLIEHFADQIGAKYKFSVDNGLRFVIDF